MHRGYWTAVVTHFAQERRAAAHVERQGFEFYLPETMNGRRRERLFPNYLFVFVRDRWRCLAGTRGIRSLLLQAERPIPMPRKDLEDIRAREDENGLIELPPKHHAGERVTVMGGMFKGQNGIYQGMPAPDRCNVLISVLGKQHRIEVDSRLVA